MNWREFVETLSVVEQTLREDPAGVYRKWISPRATPIATSSSESPKRRIPDRSDKSPTMAVELARAQREDANQRLAHVGYYLLDKGIEDLERAAGTQTFLRGRALARQVSADILSWRHAGDRCRQSRFGLMPLAGARGSFALAARRWRPFLILLCASQLAVSLVNWFATVLSGRDCCRDWIFRAAFRRNARDMVVVPTMLSSMHGHRRSCLKESGGALPGQPRSKMSISHC